MPESTASKRTHERLIAYWQGLRGDQPFPSENDVDPDALAEDWNACFLLNMQKGSVADGFRYEYMSPSLVEAYGADMTGVDQQAGETPLHIASMLQSFDKVVTTGAPVMDESEFKNTQNVEVKYRSCLLPLGGKSGKVEYILGCMRWKFF